MKEAELERSLAVAVEARVAAEDAAAASSAVAGAARTQLEEVSAERRVLQDTVSNMRQECTERWVRDWVGLKTERWVRDWVGLKTTDISFYRGREH